METTSFILALGKTLPASCLQGFTVYLVLQLLFLADKKSTPLVKFNCYYVANWLLFAGFMSTFFHYYQPIADASFINDFSPTKTTGNFQTTILKPDLWFKLSFWVKHYAYIITCFYLVGLTCCVLKLSLGIVKISFFRNNRHLKLDENLTQTCIRSSSNFRLIKTASVYLSDKVFVPLTLGFIKPIIVFPIALINQLSAAQTEAILLHELAHIKRNDYLLNILLCIVQSFLFFNPAIWLMQREINKYREQCCDDLVLDQTQNQLAYARALLLIEQYRSNTLNLTLASNGKKYNLLNRIKRITNMKTNETSPQNKLVLLLLAIITIGLTVAWNMPVKKVSKNSIINRSSDFNRIKIALNPFEVKFSDDKILPFYKARNVSMNKVIADTIYVDYQSRKKPSQKLSFQDKEIYYNLSADTSIKSKNKFKIVLEDSVGNKREYNSIEELPADARKDFLKENENTNKLGLFNNNFNDTSNYALVRKYYNSPEWKKKEDAINKMGRDVDNYYNSPEWKKKMSDIKIYGEKLRKQINSPEWKKQQEELRKQDEKLRKQMNNPEFKKQMEDIKVQSEEIQKQFNSPEWKKQMADIEKQGEEIRKQFNSPEWKKQMKESIDSAQKNWKNSSDYQPRPGSKLRYIKPEQLH
ncbi:M56 family metallopeptidase [Mucilaginibacter sp.]|uniref:M56 family metallopeptidase n=1 Tax=Mucilaginibacter sp. TaxID=1882438 RepID=UPI003AFF8F8D